MRAPAPERLRPPRPRRRRRACRWLALLLLLPGSLRAQEVRGRVLESGTRRPVMLATVTLLDSAKVAVDRTYTDESSVFVLKAGKAGSYFVLCERIGYKRTLDGMAGSVFTGVPGATLDDVVEVRDIAAIEVHAGPASLPLSYGGTSTSCATILIWTKSGAAGE